MGVAVGGQHFKGLLAVHFINIDDGDIEGAAAQIVHGNLLLALALILAVGDGSGRRLVDDALDIEACNAAGILSSLTLAVIEVGRAGDHSLSDFLP